MALSVEQLPLWKKGILQFKAVCITSLIPRVLINSWARVSHLHTSIQDWISGLALCPRNTSTILTRHLMSQQQPSYGSQEVIVTIISIVTLSHSVRGYPYCLSRHCYSTCGIRPQVGRQEWTEDLLASYKMTGFCLLEILISCSLCLTKYSDKSAYWPFPSHFSLIHTPLQSGNTATF